MKEYRIILCAVMLALLWGCGEPGQNAARKLEAAIFPACSSEVDLTKTLPQFPFGRPQELEFMSYDEYDSICRTYHAETNAISHGLSWKWQDGADYDIMVKNGTLYINGDRDGLIYKVAGQDGLDGCRWVLADGYWIYGIREDEELFRVDYFGEQYEVLLNSDRYGFKGLGEGNFTLFDHCSLYFKALTEAGAAYCRLYLPESRFEVLFETENCAIQTDQISNYETVYTENNPDFAAALEAVTTDRESDFYGPVTDGVAISVSVKLRIPMYYFHYLNAHTGEHYTIERYGNYGEWINRTAENVQKNGEQWWKDFQ